MIKTIIVSSDAAQPLTVLNSADVQSLTLLNIAQVGLPGATGATGATGLPGATGSTGATGAIGATGLNGSNGLDGKTILNGIVDPTTEGVNGDFYINTATHYIFGPKAADTWPSGVSIIGATGATGATGASNNILQLIYLGGI